MMARQWLEEHDTFWNNREVISGFVESWLKSDRDAAVNFVIAHNQSDSFAESIALVSTELYKNSPDQARAFLFSLKPEQRSFAIRAVGADFDSPDPNGEASRAAKWLFELPRPDWEGHLGTVLAQWMEISNSAAISWIKEHAVAERDVLVAELVRSQNVDIKSELAHMAFGISDRNLRQETLRQLVMNLRNVDNLEQGIRELKLSKSQTHFLLDLNRKIDATED